MHARSGSTTQTSNGTCDRRPAIDSNSSNGETRASPSVDGSEPLELRDTLVVQTTDGREIEFEVVGLVEDENNVTYAVCYSEKEDQFVVTDAGGNLLADDDLAQEILDDFFVLAEEAAPEEEDKP
ncbi:MAG: hypothetical protein JO140_01380 [Candidatus Eremiobacteraeota bacterium]|nr:hypothetical protein [Candidatus Eremiobacteraeota bacterium]